MPLGHGQSRSVTSKDEHITHTSDHMPLYQKEATPTASHPSPSHTDPGATRAPELCSCMLRGGRERIQHESTATDFLPCQPFPISSLRESPRLLQTGTGVSLHSQVLKEGRSPGSSLGVGLLSRSSLNYRALSRTLAPREILFSSRCTTLLLKLPDFTLSMLAKNKHPHLYQSD